MGTILEVNSSGQVLQANFDAFKFPTSDVVQFRALVTPCIPRCDPVNCEVTDYYGRERNVQSYGKRRKRRDTDDDSSPTSEEREVIWNEDLQFGPDKHLISEFQMMVAGVIHISDKFELTDKMAKKHDDGGGGKIYEDGESGVYFSSPGDDDVYSRPTQDNDGDGGGETCVNTFAFAAGAAVFLLAQCVLIGFWTLLYRKKRRLKDANNFVADTAAAIAAATAASKRNISSNELHDSSLRDYDPYFEEDFVRRRGCLCDGGRTFASNCSSQLFVDDDRFRRNRKRRRFDAADLTQGGGGGVSSGPSSLSSLGQRNL